MLFLLVVWQVAQALLAQEPVLPRVPERPAFQLPAQVLLQPASQGLTAGPALLHVVLQRLRASLQALQEPL